MLCLLTIRSLSQQASAPAFNTCQVSPDASELEIINQPNSIWWLALQALSLCTG